MAEEQLQRADSNLKPSELKAAFKRSRDIDALLDEERELKEKEVQRCSIFVFRTANSLKMVLDK